MRLWLGYGEFAARRIAAAEKIEISVRVVDKQKQCTKN
jgi:hypothetical protein